MFWLRPLVACGPLLPSLLLLFHPPPWSIPLFTPRQLIYANHPLPFLLAPWATPNSLPALLSRFFQAALLWVLPVSTFECYQLWILTAVLRTILGHILTRSVGWALPRFFSHWALYETCGGYGPSLIAYMHLIRGTDFPKSFYKRSYMVGELVILVTASAILSWLDNTPWTYGVAIGGAGVITLGRWLVRMFLMRPALHPLLPDGQKQTSSPKIRTLLTSTLLSLFTLSFPYALLNRTATFIPTEMPLSPSPPSPLLEILILSYPRPSVSAATMIMNITISSYLPFLSSEVSLSVFTHSTSHPAFDNTRDTFKETNVTFHADADSHPDANSNQYLHLSEAFRWTLERPLLAEWVMLVEDDFPICGGDRGWDAVRRVMKTLEGSRSKDTKSLTKQGGFVGTGGSGLIIHRTMLPILILLMHTHAEITSKLPRNAVRRPADVIVQDCLLGTDPLCQTKDGSSLIITSQMVMDHIGGMVTTNKNKAPNNDKWRCGWRHPFHGRPQVEVIVV